MGHNPIRATNSHAMEAGHRSTHLPGPRLHQQLGMACFLRWPVFWCFLFHQFFFFVCVCLCKCPFLRHAHKLENDMTSSGYQWVKYRSNTWVGATKKPLGQIPLATGTGISIQHDPRHKKKTSWVTSQIHFMPIIGAHFQLPSCPVIGFTRCPSLFLLISEGPLLF